MTGVLGGGRAGGDRDSTKTRRCRRSPVPAHSPHAQVTHAPNPAPRSPPARATQHGAPGEHGVGQRQPALQDRRKDDLGDAALQGCADWRAGARRGAAGAVRGASEGRCAGARAPPHAPAPQRSVHQPHLPLRQAPRRHGARARRGGARGAGHPSPGARRAAAWAAGAPWAPGSSVRARGGARRGPTPRAARGGGAPAAAARRAGAGRMRGGIFAGRHRRAPPLVPPSPSAQALRAVHDKKTAAGAGDRTASGRTVSGCPTSAGQVRPRGATASARALATAAPAAVRAPRALTFGPLLASPPRRTATRATSCSATCPRSRLRRNDAPWPPLPAPPDPLVRPKRTPSRPPGPRVAPVTRTRRLIL
jgi:hypothetical protein